MKEDFKRTVLDNGVRIVSEKMRSVQSISIGIWVEAGSRDESDPQGGVSHLIEHLLFKGTEKRSALDISKEIESVGGYINAGTDRENTCYYIKAPSAHRQVAVDILFDIYLHSRFDPEEVERERQVVLQEVRMTDDSPEELIHDNFQRAMWGEHPIGRPIQGTMETVGSISREGITAYFNEVVKKGNLVVAAAGDIDHSWLVDTVASSLEDAVIDFEPKPRSLPESMAGVSVQTKDLEQVHLCLGVEGLAAVDENRYALYLFNTILGVGMSSRLFQEIREKRGLAYAIGSFLSLYTDAGVLGVYAGTTKEHVEEVLSVVRDQLVLLRNKKVDSANISRAKEQIKGSLLISNEGSGARMSRIAKNEIYYQRHIPIKESVARIDKVTGEQLKKVTGNLIRSDNLLIAALGNLEVDDIPDELRTL
ncbi:M16 family metallopeptidase [Thermodesulfobacteriota bacterium]